MPNKNLSPAEGLFAPLSKNPASYAMVQIEAVLKKYGYTLNTPWNEIDKNIQEYLINGSGEERFNYSYVNMYDEYKEYFSPFEGVVIKRLIQI